MATEANDTAITYFGVMEHYQICIVDPHTGIVTGTRNYKLRFLFYCKIHSLESFTEHKIWSAGNRICYADAVIHDH